jgi:hypothetical protein
VNKETISTRKYKVGYEVRKERCSGQEYGVPDGESFIMQSAYTPEGHYIGMPKDARRLVVKRGIKPQLRTEDSGVCSIGFCERENKWYGWSHRGICGFSIGDKLFEEFFEGADDHTPFVAHGRKTIETLDEARQAASNFAEHIS